MFSQDQHYDLQARGFDPDGPYADWLDGYEREFDALGGSYVLQSRNDKHDWLHASPADELAWLDRRIGEQRAMAQALVAASRHWLSTAALMRKNGAASQWATAFEEAARMTATANRVLTQVRLGERRRNEVAARWLPHADEARAVAAAGAAE